MMINYDYYDYLLCELGLAGGEDYILVFTIRLPCIWLRGDVLCDQWANWVLLLRLNVNVKYKENDSPFVNYSCRGLGSGKIKFVFLE